MNIEVTQSKSDYATEYTITDGTYTLRHFDFKNGDKHNEATKKCEDGSFEFVSVHGDNMKPLFIALRNYKNQF